jgi:hypothetical protein
MKMRMRIKKKNFMRRKVTKRKVFRIMSCGEEK